MNKDQKSLKAGSFLKIIDTIEPLVRERRIYKDTGGIFQEEKEEHINIDFKEQGI